MPDKVELTYSSLKKATAVDVLSSLAVCCSGTEVRLVLEATDLPAA